MVSQSLLAQDFLKHGISDSPDSPDSPDSGDSVFATPSGVEIWWDKNGKILFNLIKLHLTVSKSLLTQELFFFMMIDIIKVRVRAQR